MEQLCGVFGMTRQAWYAATRRAERKSFQADVVVQEVKRLRKVIPGLGTTKLYVMMEDFLACHSIKMGRDKLHNLLKERALLIQRKRCRAKTTDSDHGFYKYPNQVKDLKPERPNHLWVSDLTYLYVGRGFAYLSVIMDGYSRKIVGWSLHKTLEAKGPLTALEMALAERGTSDQELVHHSDRGVQYCSSAYVARLKESSITISMTESGDPNENALAERVFRCLKHDFRLRGFVNFGVAQAAVERSIRAYNSVRPHCSLNNLTPNRAHQKTGHHALKWYPYKKVRYGNVQYQVDEAFSSPL